MSNNNFQELFLAGHTYKYKEKVDISPNLFDHATDRGDALAPKHLRPKSTIVYDMVNYLNQNQSI